MVNYYIYAKDYSGSTHYADYYHTNGLETYHYFKNKVKDLSSGDSESKEVYLHWSNECIEVDEKVICESYRKREGCGGTEPQKIIQWIKDNKDLKHGNIKLLYIITDGLIPSSNVEEYTQMNSNINYEKVVFHAFNEQLDFIDLSVAASFLKSQCVIYRNFVLIDNVNISEDFDYDTITINNFFEEKERLKSYIKLKFLVKSILKNDGLALREIDKLKKLRDRLFNEQLLAELSAQELEKLKKLNENFNSKDKDTVIREFKQTNFYKSLNNPSNYDVKVDVEKSISTLINYIHNDKKSYAFDALKFDTKFRNEVQEESVIDVNFSNAEEIEFLDIILDDDKGVPVILLTELNLLRKIIFHSSSTLTTTVPAASFSKFKSTMECPLFLHADSDLNESIGYFYTLTVYKQLLNSSTRLEPRTRRKFHGGIVLSEEFDQYNDYILAATYFDFKKVNYNVPLFYYVLWKMCEKKEWMDRNVVDQFKKYVMRRISRYVCRIGLSSLPMDPEEKVPLPAALWYCVELSSYIFKDNDKFYTHERLRMYHGVAHYMIEILEFLNYKLDKNFIEKRVDLLKHISILKKIGPMRDKVFFMLQKIFKNDHGFLVCEIEHSENIKKLNYLKLNHKELLSEDILTNEVDLWDYVYFLFHVDSSTVERIKISDKTLRPLFVVNNNSSFYSELIHFAQEVIVDSTDNEKVEIKFNKVTSLDFQKCLSLFNLFISCVNNFNRYPTLDEYMSFVMKKKKFHKELVTIFPKSICHDIEHVFLKYQSIISNIDPKEFIKRTNDSVTRVQRIKEEEIKQFNSDDEILNFIVTEERKVNLCKMKVPKVQN